MAVASCSVYRWLVPRTLAVSRKKTEIFSASSKKSKARLPGADIYNMIPSYIMYYHT